MDQYHRQFQQEMQHRFAEAAAASEESEAGTSTTDPSKSKERVTSFDQRLCTHLAWTNLIDQLVKDATISPISLTNPASKATPYSHDSFLSSVKEVRSYNDFYIAYAQKVDIVELKQQLLLSQLEQEILSPNLNMASVSTFPSLGAAAAYNRAVNNLQKLEGATGAGFLTAAEAATVKSDNAGESDREPVDRQSDTSHIMANNLIQKVSTPSLRQQFLASRSASDPGSPSPKAYSTPDTGHGEKEKDNDEEVEEVEMIAPTARKMNQYGLVASLTQGALESFNQSDEQDPAVSVAVAATPPTPTSVAALSIRSSPRNSIRNNSISAGSGSGSATGPTASASPNASGGPHSPRIGYGGLRRQESSNSNGGLHSPHAQSATAVVDGGEGEGEGDGDPEAQRQDYFSHTPVAPPADHSSMYHQQQYHHHYQQQVNSVKRKSSLLSTVVTPSALAAPTTIAAVHVVATVVGGGGASATNSPLHSEGDEGAAQQKEPETVETLDVGPNDDDDDDDGEGSEILIALQDDDDIQDSGDPDPNVEVEPGAEGTIEIINQVSNPDHGSNHDRYQCPAEPVIKPVQEVEADADVESFAETPLGHLTPVEGGDDDDGFDSDEVVFVMMAPPGPLAPDSGPPPMHVAVPASDPGPQAPTSSLSKAASVPVPE